MVKTARVFGMKRGFFEEFEEEQIPLRWRVPIGSGYSGPSVADGRVYITDRVTKPKTDRACPLF